VKPDDANSPSMCVLIRIIYTCEDDSNFVDFCDSGNEKYIVNVGLSKDSVYIKEVYGDTN